jgi:hypothetical protein
MKERIDIEKRYTFLYPDGSVWFDLTEDVRMYEIYRIRDKWGGNKVIHKIIYDDAKRTEKN